MTATTDDNAQTRWGVTSYGATRDYVSALTSARSSRGESPLQTTFANRRARPHIEGITVTHEITGPRWLRDSMVLPPAKEGYVMFTADQYRARAAKSQEFLSPPRSPKETREFAADNVISLGADTPIAQEPGRQQPAIDVFDELWRFSCEMPDAPHLSKNP